MDKPTFPIICISTDTSVDLIPEENYLSKVSTIALTNESYFDTIISYDANGIIWKYVQQSKEFKNTFISRLLAKTLYNRLLDAEVIWTKISNYELDELKKKLYNCIDLDDDIITQFEEGDVIKSEIEQSESQKDIVAILNKYVFDVNEEELFKEQKERE